MRFFYSPCTCGSFSQPSVKTTATARPNIVKIVDRLRFWLLLILFHKKIIKHLDNLLDSDRDDQDDQDEEKMIRNELMNMANNNKPEDVSRIEIFNNKKKKRLYALLDYLFKLKKDAKKNLKDYREDYIPIWEKVFLLWSAPITKFWINLVPWIF